MTEDARLGRRLVECGYPPLRIPPAGGVSRGVVRGRYPSHGYSRGWGLEFAGLAEQIGKHPLYVEAVAAMRGRSVVSELRLMNLFLIVAHYFDALSDRNIVEFGSFRGGSALFMGYILKQLYPEAALYAHDTFEGMPDADASSDLHGRGDFAAADLDGFLAARAELGLTQLHVVKGLVQETFPASLPQGLRIGLAHFDMDIYEPTVFAQAAAWPLMTSAGYFVYDDATVSSCIGATQAVEELILHRRLHSEQVYPHFVFRIGLDGAR